MAVDLIQTLMDYLTSTLGETNIILFLELSKGVIFDFKHEFQQMLMNNPFGGATHEDPMQHSRKFIKLTNMVRQDRVPAKYIRLYAFSFSLNRKAWVQFCSVPEIGLPTWNQCISVFLRKYFSPMETDHYIKDIGNFVQRGKRVYLKLGKGCKK